MAHHIDEARFLSGSGNSSIRLLHISDPAGNIQCAITNYGARLVSCIVPDKNGQATDLALGYRTLVEYCRQPEDYMGAVVGRCANRIAGGSFNIQDQTFHTTKNEGPNTLHGGSTGLHAKCWTIIAQAPDSVTLSVVSPDGDEGFPGELSISVTYKVAPGGKLSIRYHAVTNAATPVNLSNHAYWNLSGEGSGSITDHRLQINAASFTPFDTALIPTGAIVSVAGTPLDFRQPAMIGTEIDAPDTQLLFGKGYDHNWVLDGAKGAALILSSPQSGIAMSLYTQAPGLQFYSGNGMDGTRSGKNGEAYGYRSAAALEPQFFPDSIHHGNFPDCVLRTGEIYARQDDYIFSNTPDRSS